MHSVGDLLVKRCSVLPPHSSVYFKIDSVRFTYCSEIKERIKKTKDEKKAKKAELTTKTQKTQTKSGMPKAAKGPKIGGGGGKR